MDQLKVLFFGQITASSWNSWNWCSLNKISTWRISNQHCDKQFLNRVFLYIDMHAYSFPHHAPQCLILRSTRGVFYHVQAQHRDPPGDTDCSGQTLHLPAVPELITGLLTIKFLWLTDKVRLQTRCPGCKEELGVLLPWPCVSDVTLVAFYLT